MAYVSKEQNFCSAQEPETSDPSVGQVSSIASTSDPALSKCSFPSTDAVTKHLSELIQLPSVSNANGTNAVPMSQILDQLRKNYPLTFERLQVDQVGDGALLRWQNGTNPNLDPVMFVAHTDVVPVSQTSIDKWKQLPFSGNIADGQVWGRGAIDDKSSVVGILDSVESLLKCGHQPQRGLLIALGNDEETFGLNGAKAIAEHLKSEGINKVSLIVDEGGYVTKGIIQGVSEPVSIVGVQEKGVALFTLKIEGEGGHASAPDGKNPIVRMSKAIAELEENQMPSSIQPAVAQTNAGLSPKMPRWQQLAVAHSNGRFLGGAIRSVIDDVPEQNSMIRTVCTPTESHIGDMPTAVPSKGTTTLNCYVLPGDSIEKTKAHIESIVGKYGITVETVNTSGEPSKLSPSNTPEFRTVASTIKEVFGTDVVPGLTPGGTDSRHYEEFSDNIIRFSPVILNGRETVEQMHGPNEHISVENLDQAAQFYTRLIKKTTSE